MFAVIRITLSEKGRYFTEPAYAVGYYQLRGDALEAGVADQKQAGAAGIGRHCVLVSVELVGANITIGDDVELCSGWEFLSPRSLAAICYTAGTVHAAIERDVMDSGYDPAILCGEVEYAS